MKVQAIFEGGDAALVIQAETEKDAALLESIGASRGQTLTAHVEVRVSDYGGMGAVPRGKPEQVRVVVQRRPAPGTSVSASE